MNANVESETLLRVACPGCGRRTLSVRGQLCAKCKPAVAVAPVIPEAWRPDPPPEPPPAPSNARDDYDAIDAVNWSTLKHLGKSPEHYLHHLKNKGKDTDARQRGRVTHLAVFEPERLGHEVAVWHDRKQGNAWEAFAKKHAGKEVLNTKAFETAKAIGNAARNHPMASRYLAGGRAEVSARWLYRSPHVEGLADWEMWCKGRLDFIANVGAIVDLKSTRDGSPGGFAREVLRYEYHVQAAFYSDGHFALTGERLPFVFVAVEAEAPHVVQVYRVPDDIIDLGRERYSLLLAQLRICRQDNKWPGYAEAEMELTLPRWARPADDDGDVDSDLVFSE